MADTKGKKYKMERGGSTTGKHSKVEYHYKRGDVVEEEKPGDLDHVAAAHKQLLKGAEADNAVVTGETKSPTIDATDDALALAAAMKVTVGFDIATLAGKGSGPGGRIWLSDVKATDAYTQHQLLAEESD